VNVSPEQRGYLWGEIYPAIAEGIDILLSANGHDLRLMEPDEVHAAFKRSLGIASTEALSPSEACDYLTQLQALAASWMIFVASPDEWKAGKDHAARVNHYKFVLS